MDIHGFFTKKGLLLAAKLAAGSTLKYTRVCAGEAETALSASALSQIRQTLSVGEARRTGDTAVLPVTLEAGMAGSAYTLRELGVYAQDPDEGEILYKVYRLTEPVKIDPASRLVLRFYLEETVSQDLNVTVVRASAGLLTEADLEPVRATLEAKSVPSRTVSLAAADLPAYIAALPRLMTEYLVINVTGELTTRLNLYNFYGPGTIEIRGSGNFSMRNMMRIRYCSIEIVLREILFFEINGMTVSQGSVLVDRSPGHVYIGNCQFQGLGTESESVGVHAQYGISVTLVNCTISGFRYAVISNRASTVSVVAEESDATYSDNTTGIHVLAGGIVALQNGTPKLLGGKANSKNGGIIINPDGTIQ